MADLHVTHLYHGIIGVELAVAALEGLGHPGHGVHNAQTADKVHVDAAGVAHQTQYSLIHAMRDVDVQPLALQPVHQLILFFFFYSVF